jgi:hypothetical protein
VGVSSLPSRADHNFRVIYQLVGVKFQGMRVGIVTKNKLETKARLESKASGAPQANWMAFGVQIDFYY